MRRAALLAVLTLLAWAAPAAGGWDGDATLFTPVAAPSFRSADRHALRERLVTIDLALLAPAAGRAGGEPLVFNLFPDAVLEATLERVEAQGSGAFTWVGRIGEWGTAVVSVAGGVAMGWVTDPEAGTFTVRYAGDGVHAVAEVDPSSYPAEAEPKVAALPALALGIPQTRAADPVTVTVLVVYTPAAEVEVGGASGVEALAAAAVEQANLAYQDSGVAHRLELVGTRRVQYAEASFEDDLERLTDTGDGVMDEVHRWRDELQADLVGLVRGTSSDYCGIAWIMGRPDPWFEARAFSVVAHDCAVANLSFAHETGHNLGANHEREVVDEAPYYPYAYAYWDDAGASPFRTVMAYGTSCAGGPRGCPRIARYSSPDHPYLDRPSGTATADNARALNNAASVAAAFRGPVVECAGLDATIVGTDGDDVLRGTPGDDVIHAGAGNDVVDGGGGSDVICGGDGDDTMRGGDGNNVLLGGAGNDVLRGGAGDDVLRGGAGDDLLLGGDGVDRLRGGPGADHLYGQGGGDRISGDGGKDALWGGPGDDIVRGRAGDDLLDGGGGNDVLRGNARDDTLAGGRGDDRLFGEDGDDSLDGGPGVDRVDGGDGADSCLGEVQAACEL